MTACYHLVQHSALQDILPAPLLGDDRISNVMHDEVDCTYVPSVMQCTVDLRHHLKMKTVNMKVMEELFCKG
jgi:hypothetical protein